MTVFSSGASVRVDPRWEGADGLFGGYVVALALDAVAGLVAADGLAPVSIGVNFVAGTAVADVDLDVEVLHAGRSTAVHRVAVVQGGRPRLHATVESVRRGGAEDAGGAGVVWRRRLAPAEPPASGVPQAHDDLPFCRLFDLRRGDPPALSAATTTWVRPLAPASSVGLVTDAALLAAVLDLPTPGLFGEQPPPAFVPTVDYTVHLAPAVQAPLAGAWLRLDHATAWATRHHCVDETSVSTADGLLLAQLRQTRAVRW